MQLPSECKWSGVFGDVAKNGQVGESAAAGVNSVTESLIAGGSDMADRKCTLSEGVGWAGGMRARTVLLTLFRFRRGRVACPGAPASTVNSFVYRRMSIFAYAPCCEVFCGRRGKVCFGRETDGDHGERVSA
jgi:hypothetical protein